MTRDDNCRSVCSGRLIKRAHRLKAAAVSLFCCVLASSTGTGATPQSGGQAEASSGQHQHHHTPAKQGEQQEAVKPWIPDSAVLDQDGKELHFYRDLVKGKVVVISLIYTTCTSFCPLMGARFAKLQAALGERLGKEVYLISVSTDPVTDTPARLKAWGARFGARPGWALVTGDKAEIDRLLLALNSSLTRTGYHDPVVLVGGDEQGKWIRTFALEETSVLTAMLDQMVKRPAVKEPAMESRQR